MVFLFVSTSQSSVGGFWTGERRHKERARESGKSARERALSTSENRNPRLIFTSSPVKFVGCSTLRSNSLHSTPHTSVRSVDTARVSDIIGTMQTLNHYYYYYLILERFNLSEPLNYLVFQSTHLHPSFSTSHNTQFHFVKIIMEIEYWASRRVTASKLSDFRSFRFQFHIGDSAAAVVNVNSVYSIVCGWVACAATPRYGIFFLD